MVNRLTIVVAAAAVLLFGCSRDIQNKEAVRQGILDYLAQTSHNTGLDLKAIDIDVTTMSFQRNQVNATVYFRPKASRTPGDGMQMSYTLERSGDHWKVKGRGQSGPHGHGASGMPPAAPSGELPPGHPPVGSQP